jgi:hypothetical protein
MQGAPVITLHIKALQGWVPLEPQKSKKSLRAGMKKQLKFYSRGGESLRKSGLKGHQPV